MTEGVSMSPEDAAASRAAEQARLRKERREAKLKAGGASRLNKISGLAGGLPRDEPTTSTPTAQPTSPPQPQQRPQQQQQAQAQAHADPDPDEVDISQHYYQPRATPRIPTPGAGTGTPDDDPTRISEDALRQMMLGFDNGSSSTTPGGGPGPMNDEMFLQMMMQQLGGAGAGGPGGGGGGGGRQPQFPFGAMPGAGGAGAANPFASMLGNMPGMPPMMGGQPTPEEAVLLPPDRYAALWRILHTAVALGLGLYIALWTSFSGTKLDRDLSFSSSSSSPSSVEGKVESGKAGGEMAKKFFWAFATAEALLLTTRFFMDRGRAPAQQGLLGMVAGFLPGRIGNFVKVGLQYGQIFSTVKADILVCVFVLGACSWLRS